MKHPKFDKQDYEIIFPLIIFLIVGSGLMSLVRFNVLDPQKQTPYLKESTLISAPTATVENSIHIGTYIDNIYNFSIINHTFDADGWIWIKWPQKVHEYFEAHKLTSDKWLHFVNQAQDWDFKLDKLNDTPIKLDDGHYYQGYKFSFHFTMNNINLHAFPFHTLKIPIIFELADYSVANPKAIQHEFQLLADKSSSFGSYINIPGYEPIAFNILSNNHQYGTNFGLNKTNIKAFIPNQLVFEASYKQSVNSIILTKIFPLIIVMSLVLFSPMLSASQWDIRLGIPPTTLLTLVFLQLSYRDKLPDIPYITFMDMIFNICYFIIVIMFGYFLWSANKLYRSSETNKAAIVEKIDTIDLRLLLFLPIATVFLISTNWIMMNHS